METGNKIKMKIAGGRDYFYQWDSGQRLIIEDAGICNEVHFTNSGRREAMVCRIWEEEGQRYVNVPNVLLQCTEMIRVYAHTTAAHMTRTNHYQTFEVKERNKPEDYVYTETEVLSYEKLEERITALEQIDAADTQVIGE